jgi:hypothetical protein
MACETNLKPKQSVSERAKEIRLAVSALDAAIAARRVQIKIGPQGAITFAGWVNEAGVSDACAYRRIMSTGSALARAEVAKAEQIAGRGVDKRTVAQGVHSHDGGHTWHGGH